MLPPLPDHAWYPVGRAGRAPPTTRRLGRTLRLAPDGAWDEDRQRHALCTAHGLMWVGPPGAPLPDAPPAPTPVHGRTASFTLDARARGHLLDVVENLLDPLHTHYVHPGLVRRQGDRRAVYAHVEPVPGGVQARYLGEERQQGLIARLFGEGVVTSIGRYRWPASAELLYLDRAGEPLLVAYVAFQPEDDASVMAYSTVTGRSGPVPRWLATVAMRALFRRVVAQDAAIVAIQTDARRATPGRGDVSTELDLLRPAITQLLRQGPGTPVRSREVRLLL